MLASLRGAWPWHWRTAWRGTRPEASVGWTWKYLETKNEKISTLNNSTNLCSLAELSKAFPLLVVTFIITLPITRFTKIKIKSCRTDLKIFHGRVFSDILLEASNIGIEVSEEKIGGLRAAVSTLTWGSTIWTTRLSPWHGWGSTWTSPRLRRLPRPSTVCLGSPLLRESLRTMTWATWRATSMTKSPLTILTNLLNLISPIHRFMNFDLSRFIGKVLLDILIIIVHCILVVNFRFISFHHIHLAFSKFSNSTPPSPPCLAWHRPRGYHWTWTWSSAPSPSLSRRLLSKSGKFSFTNWEISDMLHCFLTERFGSGYSLFLKFERFGLANPFQ